MTALIDTDVLVYRYDARFPEKQAIAADLLREGLVADAIVVPHQALVEFMAVTTRPDPGILEPDVARRETEEHLHIFRIVYPNTDVVRTALLGMAHYQLSWFDAHLWAYAEHYGCDRLFSEDFQNGRYYGNVKVVDPFDPDSQITFETPTQRSNS